MKKIKKLIIKTGKIAASFFAFLTFVITTYLLEQRKEKLDTIPESGFDKVKKKKEDEIEKTDSRTLVNKSYSYEDHERTKADLKQQFGDKSDEIVEAFFRG